jgi:hypothetical protein
MSKIAIFDIFRPFLFKISSNIPNIIQNFSQKIIKKPLKIHKIAILKTLSQDFYKDKRCVVLDVSNVEVDHKDGRRDDPRLSNMSTQKMQDFQALSKCVNNAKRQHCKTCRDTNIRYDARKLGYKMPQYKGGMEYKGSCIGCYWYDPFEFNQNIT